MKLSTLFFHSQVLVFKMQTKKIVGATIVSMGVLWLVTRHYLIAILFAITAGLLTFHYFNMTREKIPGIPVVPPSSILGFSKALLSINGDAHESLMEMTEKYGAICQFYLLGETVVAINDPKMAKEAFKHAQGKGSISVSLFSLAI